MIAILHYNAGNATSVLYAVQRLGYTARITDDPELIASADKVIFPGVGAAGTAMQYLRRSGLDTLIPQLRQPVLGICLGQQLLCAYSEEGDTECLGIFDTPVRRFPPRERVPHTGWNNIVHQQQSLFHNIPQNADVYFVHSYYCPPDQYTIAQAEYIVPFAAAMQRDNFYATQFHPEKSAVVGQQILSNFLQLPGSNTSIK